jgi:hypothetical protein
MLRRRQPNMFGWLAGEHARLHGAAHAPPWPIDHDRSASKQLDNVILNFL